MFYKKTTFPEEGELVLCTVKKIVFHSVFVSLDEFQNIEGMIHISEVSPGRIRNLRDFVKEGKRIICKVLRTNEERKQVDLSLRRVSVSMRKKKNTEYKQEQKAEKILEIVAYKLKTNLEDIYKKFGFQIIEEYESLNTAFQDYIQGNADLKKLKIPAEELKVLIETIEEKIKPEKVTKDAILILKSEAPNGIDIVKSSLKKGLEVAKKQNYDANFTYLSAPKYKLVLSASDYKTAEKALEEVTSAAIKYIHEKGGEGEVVSK